MKFILWLCLLNALKYSSGRSYFVHCDFCLESSNSISDDLVQECNVTNFESPRIAGEVPVHEPTWNNSSWYTFQKADDSTALAFNLTWSHSGQHFAHARGYRLSIHQVGADASSAYIREFQINLPSGIQLIHSDMIFINYPCFGRSDEKIQVGHLYSLLLRSLPAYTAGSDHRTNEVDDFVDVPGCDDDPLLRDIGECRPEATEENNGGFHHGKDIDLFHLLFPKSASPSATTSTPATASVDPDARNEKSSEADLSWVIPVVVVVLIFALIAIGIRWFMLRKKKPDEEEDMKKKSILILTSVTGAEGDDILYLETIDLLGALMRQYGNVQVDSVMWKTRNDYTDWIYEKAKSSNRVVLVCTPLGKLNLQKSLEKDPFFIGIQLLRTHKKEKFWNFKNLQKFYVIHFDDNEKKSVPESLVSEKIKRHKLPKKLEWLFRNVSGINFNTIPNEDALAELQNYFKLINAEEKNLTMDV